MFTNATCTIIVNAPAILFVYMCKNTLTILELFSITHVYETDPFTVCTVHPESLKQGPDPVQKCHRKLRSIKVGIWSTKIIFPSQKAWIRSKIGLDSVKIGPDPVKIGADPVKIGPDPVKIGADLVKIGPDPVKIGPDPVKIGQDPVNIGTDPQHYCTSSHPQAAGLGYSKPVLSYCKCCLHNVREHVLYMANLWGFLKFYICTKLSSENSCCLNGSLPPPPPCQY